jgi:hypothetical protein
MGLTTQSGDTTMITKSTLALSALLVVSASASAFAYEAPENKIGDRYPSLEQTYRTVATNKLGSRHVMVSHTAQLGYEVPEHKISDRYPFLEQTIRVAALKTTRSIKNYTMADKSLFDRQSMRAVF